MDSCPKNPCLDDFLSFFLSLEVDTNVGYGAAGRSVHRRMPSQVDICPRIHVSITDVNLQLTAKCHSRTCSPVRSSLQASSSLTNIRMLREAAHWMGLTVDRSLCTIPGFWRRW
jgi:hypothetical protein